MEEQLNAVADCERLRRGADAVDIGQLARVSPESADASANTRQYAQRTTSTERPDAACVPTAQATSRSYMVGSR